MTKPRHEAISLDSSVRIEFPQLVELAKKLCMLEDFDTTQPISRLVTREFGVGGTSFADQLTFKTACLPFELVPTVQDPNQQQMLFGKARVSALMLTLTLTLPLKPHGHGHFHGHCHCQCQCRQLGLLLQHQSRCCCCHSSWCSHCLRC